MICKRGEHAPEIVFDDGQFRDRLGVHAATRFGRGRDAGTGVAVGPFFELVLNPTPGVVIVANCPSVINRLICEPAMVC